ncbi:hypothetical protein CRUP_017623 [Coryphaenoides rupestris]|nr:hypothetical protein CRUP_017623 [Coryphaenoides rupestris]
MTTAARPTFEPARGGRGKGEGDLSALSKQYSSRDLPGHTKIKYRQPTQDNPEEVRARDFRRELEERERLTWMLTTLSLMWDDDVVFKNCAKGVEEARKEKRFINDTLRSEFHKKFMEKYVK